MNCTDTTCYIAQQASQTDALNLLVAVFRDVTNFTI